MGTRNIPERDPGQSQDLSKMKKGRNPPVHLLPASGEMVARKFTKNPPDFPRCTIYISSFTAEVRPTKKALPVRRPSDLSGDPISVAIVGFLF